MAAVGHPEIIRGAEQLDDRVAESLARTREQ
jgi:hypothetical protein